MEPISITLHTSGKRWYISYYVELPNGKNKRKREYGFVNREKNLELRMNKLLELQKKITNYMSGVNPAQFTSLDQFSGMYKTTLEVISQKRIYLKLNAYLAIKKNLKPWLNFLLQFNLELKSVNQIKSSDILNFRNWRLQQKVSNRTINNNVDELRTLFNYIMKMPDMMLNKNPCDSIINVPARSEIHVAYTDDEAQQVFDILKEQDDYLLFYIKFISFVFLRCDEARLLQVKHFDVSNKRIILTAENNKTNFRTQKLIPDIFIDEVIAKEFYKYPKDFYIFTSSQEPGPVPVNKDYFSKKFRPYKQQFGFTKLHTIYGFRHTFVSQLLMQNKEWHKIMKLTGHRTLDAFQKYARSVLQLPGEDLSDGFKIKM